MNFQFLLYDVHTINELLLNMPFMSMCAYTRTCIYIKKRRDKKIKIFLSYTIYIYV